MYKALFDWRKVLRNIFLIKYYSPKLYFLVRVRRWAYFKHVCLIEVNPGIYISQ